MKCTIVRAGVRYPIDSGDYVKEKNIGFLGGFGIEFFNNKMVSRGIEVAYDTSSITFEKIDEKTVYADSPYRPPYPRTIDVYAEEDINQSEITVSIFAVF